MPDNKGFRRQPSSPRWVTFVRNHAQTILACDFFTIVTASFRVLYIFVIMDVGTRRMTHFNATAHPTAGLTLQQFREAITGEEPCRITRLARSIGCLGVNMALSGAFSLVFAWPG